MIDPSQLAELESAVIGALKTRDETGLSILGYGEISAVVAWPTEHPRWACKRLPPFRDRDQFDRYQTVFSDYVADLRNSGIEPLESSLQTLEADKGLVGYCVQPIVDPSWLVPHRLAEGGIEVAESVVDPLVDRILRAVSPHLGLDAQISNWVVRDDGSVAYLDLTTPLIRDDEGNNRLDADLFLASLPWLLRGIVRRFMLRDIIEKYHQPRGVLLDLLGNLYKEQLETLIPPLLDRINPRLDDPIAADEVLHYYKDDAKTWALLQRLRRWDRGWQRHVRRRVYPFLIPEKIERHV